ncbi:MAG: FtsX-like permease family protein [Bacteroidota bacterium]
MVSNYVKTSLRNIRRRKGFTIINYIGLTVGTVAIVLVGLYLKNEWTYDQHIPEEERIFSMNYKYRDQIYSNVPFTDYFNSDFGTQQQLTAHLKEYDDVQTACQFVPTESAIMGSGQFFVEVGSDRFTAENALYTNTGEAFQSIFPQTFLQGTAATAFSDFGTIVLTEKIAQRWFGSTWKEQDLVGRTLKIGEDNYQLAGVIEYIANNTHFDFNFIIHSKLIPSWGAYTYLKLAPNASIAAVEARFNQEVEKVYPGKTEDELFKGFSMIALADIHFTPDRLYELKPIANTNYLTTFALIACIILLVVWINYTNLSIAMYADRKEELGMRKVLGARRKDIVAQLLIEASLLALICFPACWLLLKLILPYFNELMQTAIPAATVSQATTLLALFGLLLLTGLLSGLYPALAYSKQSLLKLFKDKANWTKQRRVFNFRNALVTGQFVMLIALLSLTYFIYQQMNYVSNKDLGFEKENIIYFPLSGREKFDQLKTQLTALPEIEAVGPSATLGADMANQLTYKLQGSDVTFTDGSPEYLDVGTMEALELDCGACEQLKAGKDQIFVINQTAAEKLAKVNNIAPEELIGQTLVTEPEYYDEENQTFGFPYVIDGIIDDYNYHNLKIETQPMFIQVYANMPWVYYVMVRANTNDWESTIQDIKTAYASVEAERPFDFTFLDQHLSSIYETERNTGILLALLSLTTLILALMGLAGVVSYLAQSKEKEIGIRKVLGASVSSILMQFNREFLLLVGFATLITLPIALYLGQQWLNSFAYRIQPQFWVILLAAVCTAFIVMLLVSLQSHRAASRKPAETLRSE